MLPPKLRLFESFVIHPCALLSSSHHARAIAYDNSSSLPLKGSFHTIWVLALFLFCSSSSNRLWHTMIPRRRLIFIIHRASFSARLLSSADYLISPVGPPRGNTFAWNSLVRFNVGFFVRMFFTVCFYFDQKRHFCCCCPFLKFFDCFGQNGCIWCSYSG